ncbi:MAG: UrcA family protein [Phenylobacterium sp.]
MKNFAAKIAGVATLALAALPLAALSTHAQAATARVHVADLNLASIDGVATFHQRVAVAAKQICGDEKNLGQQVACKAGVRTEVQEKLSQRQITLASVN